MKNRYVLSIIIILCVSINIKAQKTIFEQIIEITDSLNYSCDTKQFKNTDLVKGTFREYNIYSNNPFIGENLAVLRSEIEKYSPNPSSPNPPTIEQGLLRGFSSIPITTAVDGLSKFLVKRTKSELSIAFFRDFKEQLNRDDLGLKILFPTSASTLNVIDEEIYRFNAYIEVLREAFINDLEALPFNMSRLMREAKFRNFFNLKESEVNLIADLLEAAQLLVDEQSLPEIIDLLGQRSQQCNSCSDRIQNFRANLQVAQLISNSLLSSDTNQTWISYQDLIHNCDPSIIVKTYLGLFWAKGGKIKFTNGNTLRDKLILSDSSLYTNQIENLLLAGQRLDNLIKEIKTDKKQEEKGYEKYYQFITLALDLFEGFVNIGQKENIQDFQSSLTIVRALLTLPIDVKRRQYASAITNVNIAINYLLEDKGKSCQLGVGIIKYGAFISSVAKATDSDEVASAIEAFALPVGSASIKKNAKLNFALNAYVGPKWSWPIAQPDSAGYLSITAPVGLSLSGSIKGHSISLYPSIIDIGAVTALRFQDNTISLPEITLDNIIAPGVHIVWGLPRIPVSLSLGAQAGPSLRRINNNQAALSPRYWYYGVSATVDIPILNIYSSGKNIKKCK